MEGKNRQIILAERPKGMPQEADFKLVETDLPELAEGQFLARTNYLSVDPYMRGLIGGGASYMEPVPVGGVMIGGTVGTVVKSRHVSFREGDEVAGAWGWQEFGVSNGTGVERVEPSLAPVSTALGVLGAPGMTAYFGLLEIARPKAGESVFVSGAAGAVGSLAGQIAKLQGCRVAGSAGSDEKVAHLLNDLHFDAAFNYKPLARGDYYAKVQEACPNGVDVYFDNVGGSITDAVFPQLNVGARVVVCGQIEQYNLTRPAIGPRLLWYLIIKRARAEGFLVFQFADRYREAREQIAQWLRAGKITYRESVVDGLENAPKAFIGLFQGANIGKQLVRV